VVPCDFADWINVLSDSSEGDDSIVHILILSLPHSSAAIFPPPPPPKVGSWRVKEV
jgi:hypothetical protein